MFSSKAVYQSNKMKMIQFLGVFAMMIWTNVVGFMFMQSEIILPGSAGVKITVFYSYLDFVQTQKNGFFDKTVLV